MFWIKVLVKIEADLEARGGEALHCLLNATLGAPHLRVIVGYEALGCSLNAAAVLLRGRSVYVRHCR